jgi:predicted O-methyltransferase YrrM
MIYDELNLSDVEGWLLPAEAQFLYEIAKKSNRVLEIGCFMGRSTCAISAGLRPGCGLVVCDSFRAEGTSREAEFYGCENVVLGNLIVNLRTRGLSTPMVICGDSICVHWLRPQFDFIFIDGSHDEDSVRQDLATAQQVALPGCVVAVHDYGDPDRPGLYKAVNDFFAPDVPLTHPGNSIAWGRV